MFLSKFRPRKLHYSHLSINQTKFTTLNKNPMFTALNDNLTSFPTTKFSTNSFSNPFLFTITAGTLKLVLTRHLLPYEIIVNYILRGILWKSTINIISSNTVEYLDHLEYEFRIEVYRKIIISEAIVTFSIKNGKVVGNHILVTYPTTFTLGASSL